MSLSQGMVLLHQPPQALLDHMGVDLGGRDVGVPQKLLDRAQIRAPLQQVAREGVPQDMRRDPGRIEVCRERERLELLTEALTGDVLTAIASGKQPRRARERAFLPQRLAMRRKRLRAGSLSGTSRSRPPLPLMVSTRSSAARTLRGSAMSSDTRKPEA